MHKAQKIALSMFFFAGERIALVALFLFAVLVLNMQSSRPAFSESASAENLTVKFNIEGAPPAVTFTPTPTPSPTPTPTPSPTPTPTPVPVDVNDNFIWYRLADCESHRNWGDNTGNGYYGGLQFSQGAWQSVGGSGLPSDASGDEQIMRGKMLQARRGWGAWGACAKKLGLY
jgi:hypothetical protein